MIDTKALRQKILDLAFQGKLTEQLPEDGTGEELFQQIQEEKRKLEAEGKIKKSKPLPQIDEAEIPFEIPTNWIWTKVGMISDIAGGTTPKQHEISSVGVVPYFKVSDMNNPGNELEMNHVEWFVNEYYTGQIFPAGTIIFPKNGGAALTNKRRILVTQSVIDLNTAGCSPYVIETTKWIKYFFDTIDFGTFNTGTTIPTVNSGKIKNLLIPLPPYGEIERIIGRIDEAYSIIESIEKLIEKYNRDNLLLKSKLINAAIQGKLTEQLPKDGTAEELYQQIQQEKRKLVAEGKIKKEKALPPVSEDEIPFDIPDSWKWVRIADVCNVINGDRGKNYPAKNTLHRSGIPFISAINLNGSTVVQDDKLFYLSEEQFNILGNGKLEKDDVVLCIRGSLGKHGKYPFDLGAIASSLVIIRPFIKDDYLISYLMLFLDTDLFFDEIKKYDNGTAQPNLAAKSLEQFLLPLPSLIEIKHIVNKLDELLQLCE